ncbi:DUF397 domain-containing protein [Streptomyces sp. NPDC093084]|uniref:DUF397 domain-containing protein n=1 Tax=Streptomyces sp. NPDC093084 TaxID=3155197 RepID=UPI003419631E
MREGAALAEHRGAVSWRKSSYSGNDNDDNCCEVATLSGNVLVRDSKRCDDAVLAFRPDSWHAAIALFLVRDGTGQDDG